MLQRYTSIIFVAIVTAFILCILLPVEDKTCDVLHASGDKVGIAVFCVLITGKYAAFSVTVFILCQLIAFRERFPANGVDNRTFSVSGLILCQSIAFLDGFHSDFVDDRTFSVTVLIIFQLIGFFDRLFVDFVEDGTFSVTVLIIFQSIAFLD